MIKFCYFIEEPLKSIQESIVLPLKTLIFDEVLRNTYEDVKISVIVCLVEITKTTTPNTIYNEDTNFNLM